MSKPVFGCCPYDVVVDTGKKMIRVQVKWFDKPHRLNSNQFSLKKGRIGYSGHEYDVLAVRFPGAGDWYFLELTKPISGIRRTAAVEASIGDWSIVEK